MYKRILFLIAVLFATQSVLLAQSKVEEIELKNRNSTLWSTLDLGDKGLVLDLTRFEFGGKGKITWELLRYSKDLELLWRAPIRKTRAQASDNTHLIASPDASYFYHLEDGIYTKLGERENQVTQIDSLGNVKTYNVGSGKEVGDMKMVFCSNDYYYVLAKIFPQKDSTKFQLSRFAHEDFAVESKVLDLPNSNTPWEYVGSKDDYIYLYQKRFNLKDQEYNIQVAKLDTEGEVLEIFPLDFSLTGERYVCNFDNHMLLNGNFQNRKDQFYWKTQYVGQEMQRIPKPRSTALGNLVLYDDTFYFYGLYSPKPHKLKPRDEGDVDGYFIHAYSLSGEQLWQTTNEFEEREERSYLSNYYSYFREIALNKEENGNLNLVMNVLRWSWNYNLSSEGEFLDSKYNKFPENAGNAGMNKYLYPAEDSELSKYIAAFSKNERRKLDLYYFGSSGEDILLEESFYGMKLMKFE